MEKVDKIEIRKAFGNYLQARRLEITKQDNLLVFSYTSGIDNSKLAKIEKGQVNFGFDLLVLIQKAYKLTDKEILGFNAVAALKKKK
ncbi:MAG TPA: hypothetical protein VLC98_10725 [Phnomibacter sp.]|nr:hypothetical protein [Phnomibacter sp.]